MDLQFINPFIASTMSAFSSMLGCELNREDISMNGRFQPQFELTSIIGVTGQLTGTIVLSLDREVAISATEALLGERPSCIDADVIDATGELTNIVAGGAKARLTQYALYLALPTVIVGHSHIVTFESSVRPICVPFSCDWGHLTLEIGFGGGRH